MSCTEEKTELSNLIVDRQNLIWNSDLPSHDKFLLLVLHKYQLGNDCLWPRNETLAATASMTKRNLQRRLKDLEGRNLISSSKRSVRGKWMLTRSINYSLLASMLAVPHDAHVTSEGGRGESPDDAHVTPESGQGVTPTSSPHDAHVTPDMTPTSPPHDAGVTPDMTPTSPSNNKLNRNESSSNPSAAKSEEERIVDLMVKDLAETDPNRRKPDTSDWIKPIHKLLSDGMSADRILDVWSRGIRDSFWSGLCLDARVLERNFTTIEKRAAKPSPEQQAEDLADLGRRLAGAIRDGDFENPKEAFDCLSDGFGRDAAENFFYVVGGPLLKKINSDEASPAEVGSLASRFASASRGCWMSPHHSSVVEGLRAKAGTQTKERHR